MPGKDKKNQKNTIADNKEKTELTPEQRAALARKEYMDSLEHIGDIVRTGNCQ